MKYALVPLTEVIKGKVNVAVNILPFDSGLLRPF